MMNGIDRRALIGIGLGAGFAADALGQSVAQGNAVSEVAAPARPEPTAKYRVPFAVVGLDHAHIYSITDAMIRGGGVLTPFYTADPAQVATFRKR
jgi:hypothetical protein